MFGSTDFSIYLCTVFLTQKVDFINIYPIFHEMRKVFVIWKKSNRQP